MRTLLAAVTAGLLSATSAAAQTPDTTDAARADSAARARADSAGARPEAARPEATSKAPSAQTRGPATYMNIGFSGLADAGWSSARDLEALQPGDHDPHVRGFTIPNVELTFDGAVDPYFKGFANIVYKIESDGSTGVELEEAYFLTASLPANLQLKGGQFFAEFGRQNAQHPHAWSFVDQPLVLNRMFGPDGFRSQGIRLSWLFPTSWYAEAMVSVLNSGGETVSSFRSDESSEIHGGVPVEREVLKLQDMLVMPRITASFDLTSTQTLLVGASAAFGPNNAGASTRTEIYGGDVYWKWKSARADRGFPFASFQAEMLFRRYGTEQRESATDPGVTLPPETLRDQGAYAQVLWGIKPRIVAGLRGEYASGDDAAFDAPLRADRSRLSPNLTWYPSEFSKVRLQYNFDDRAGIGRDHSFWVQFEFILGAHAAHKF